jgi:allantoinase
MTSRYPRDLVGYGANPPDPKWPRGARLALNFVVNYEEGSEPSILDGEDRSELGLTDGSGIDPGIRGRDLAAEGMFAYGSRVGFWRVVRLFQERKLPLTVFGCALALERNPQAAAEIRRSGYDVCCHGWRWIKHYDLSEADERDHIRKAIGSIQATIGARPLGWYCRYGPSLNTRRLLIEEGGFATTATLTTMSCPTGSRSRAGRTSLFPIHSPTTTQSTAARTSARRTTSSRIAVMPSMSSTGKAPRSRR